MEKPSYTLIQYQGDELVKLSRLIRNRPWELVLIVMSIIFSLSIEQFASAGNLSNILIQIAPLLLLAVGQSFILITGGIDLSQGAVIGVISVLFVTMTASLGFSYAFLVTVIVCVIYYCIISLLVTLLRGGLNPLIVTLSAMYMLTGLIIFITGGTPISLIGENVQSMMEFINNSSFFSVPMSFWIACTVLSFAYILLHRTTAGILIYAVGDNPTAARAHGLSIFSGRTWAYVANGVLTAVAGILLTCRIYQGNPHLGEGLLFDSIGGAVLGGVSLAGGIGGVWYAIRGVLLIFLIQNALYLTDLNSSVRDIAVGLLILIGFTISLKKRGVS